ncbi:hypothetical protein GEMRC1_006885 [Eukaryota sp. GEM-RC1]
MSITVCVGFHFPSSYSINVIRTVLSPSTAVASPSTAVAVMTAVASPSTAVASPSTAVASMMPPSCSYLTQLVTVSIARFRAQLSLDKDSSFPPLPLLLPPLPLLR